MKKVKSTSRFKMLVSGDRFSIEQKNKGQISILPTVKLIFAVNTIPDTDDDGYGYFVRWVLIPLDITIPFEDQDKDLKFKLTTPEEMSEILNFALEGLNMLLADGGFENIGSIMDVKKMYKESSDMVYAFVNRYYSQVKDNPVTDSFHAVPSKEVQEVFIGYLKAEKNKNKIASYLNLKMFEMLDDDLPANNDKITKNEDKEIDLDKSGVRAIAIQVLGRELSRMGIVSRQLINKITNEREYHYVGLKREYNLRDEDGQPIIGEWGKEDGPRQIQAKVK